MKKQAQIIIAVILLLIIAMAVCSCTTTKYVTVPEYHLRDSTKIVYQRDSIFQKDSVYIYFKGDTIFHEHYNIKYREFLRHDTLNIVSRDSVRVPYPVVKDKIVYQLRWYQKAPYYIGWIAIIAILIYGGIWSIKKGILHM